MRVENAANDTSHDINRKATLQSSSTLTPKPMPTQRATIKSNVNVCESARSMSSFLPSNNYGASGAGSDLGVQSENRVPTVKTSHPNFSDESFGNRTMHSSHVGNSAEVLIDDIDDDELLKVTHMIRCGSSENLFRKS